MSGLINTKILTQALGKMLQAPPAPATANKLVENDKERAQAELFNNLFSISFDSWVYTS